jgi:hypothetical protein
MDRGLISEKQRGLSAKSTKLNQRLISKKHRGFFAKWRGISAGIYFSTDKGVDWVHAPVDHERHRPTVDHGHRPGGGSPEIGRNGVPVRGISPLLRKNGEGTEVSLTEGKRGRRRVRRNRAMVGNNWRRRRSMEGELETRKHSIKGEVSVVMARGNALMPLMVGRLDEGLRSEIKEGNQGVE